MTLTRAVATKRGQPTEHRTLSAADEAARLAEIDAAAPATLRKHLRRAFIDDGVARISVQEPAWDSFERVALIASIWTRLGAPSPAQALAKDIYLYVRDTALPKLAPLTLAQLQAIDPAAADPFGDGTPWPT